MRCFCARISCSLLRKIHPLTFELRFKAYADSSLRSFVSLTVSVPVSKKQRVNGFYPFLDSLRTVPFFYPFPYKTCACKRSNFVGTGALFLPEPFRLF